LLNRGIPPADLRQNAKQPWNGFSKTDYIISGNFQPGALASFLKVSLGEKGRGGFVYSLETIRKKASRLSG